MKKIILLAAALVLTASSLALACGWGGNGYGGYCWGNDGNYGRGYGPGYCWSAPAGSAAYDYSSKNTPASYVNNPRGARGSAPIPIPPK